MRTMRGLAVVAAAVLMAMLPGVARAEAPRDVPRAGPLPFVPDDIPDRVIAGSRVRAASGLVRSARTRSYRTADGQQVEVAVSASYPEDTTADKALVDFLATRAHGRELGALRLFVGRPAEVASLCGGGGTVACYATAEQRMYVPGEDTPEVPMEYVITHEYGHHLASWRRNDPWDALDWGPKRWASAAGVCAGVRRGALFPGNQGRHYFDDPGEGFADGYAHLHYPQQAWRYNPLLRPDARVIDAIRADVESPWTRPRTRVLRGRASGTLRLPLTLDGDVKLRLVAPAGARYELRVGTRRWSSRRELVAGASIGVEACRPAGVASETMTLAVRRLAGGGTFRLVARYPG
jgi:hypothetical protein